MASFANRILLAVRDLGSVPRASFKRAAALARGNPRARIELFHAYDDLRGAEEGPHDLRRLAHESLNSFIEKRLARLAGSPLLSACKVTVHAVHDHPVHDAIVRRAIATRADMVIIEFHAHIKGARLFLRNTDWELIRTCPCPLLIARGTRLRTGAAVVAAVDPRHANDKPARLDRRILKIANALGNRLGAPVHACYAVVPLSVQLAVSTTIASPGTATPVWVPPEVDKSQRRAAERALDRIASAQGVPANRRHLVSLDATSALVELTKQLRAGTVVMGAVSRSGLRRIVIGSTAERTLDALDTDVLVVKPAGFRTPAPSRIARLLARL
jgi:universal stress protein E